MFLYKYIPLVSMFVLSGCASIKTNSIVNMNNNLTASDSAYRMLKVINSQSNTTYELQPAGIKQQSIAVNSEIVSADIFKGIYKQCGFDKKDLIETRFVSRNGLKFYEVWVFKDKLSAHESKLSAISVLLEQYPNGGGVDISLSNKCQTKPLKFVFTK